MNKIERVCVWGVSIGEAWTRAVKRKPRGVGHCWKGGRNELETL